MASLCWEHWGRRCPWCSMWQWSLIPWCVWKVVFVYCSRRALSHIGVGLMGCCPGIYTCVGICGRVMHRDLWSYFYSRMDEWGWASLCDNPQSTLLWHQCTHSLDVGGEDSRHFGPVCLLFLSWCRECPAACVVFFFVFLSCQHHLIPCRNGWCL